MWVRGLKLTLLLIVFGVGLSHPMWVRGLKPPTSSASALLGMVAPHVGVWIETVYNQRTAADAKSHPMWVRGLKRL